MKKKIIGGIAVLTIAAAAAFNVSLNAQEENLSNISLANVEALADGESTPTECPGGLTLCAWIKDPLGSTTYYKKN